MSSNKKIAPEVKCLEARRAINDLTSQSIIGVDDARECTKHLHYMVMNAQKADMPVDYVIKTAFELIYEIGKTGAEYDPEGRPKDTPLNTVVDYISGNIIPVLGRRAMIEFAGQLQDYANLPATPVRSLNAFTDLHYALIERGKNMPRDNSRYRRFAEGLAKQADKYSMHALLPLARRYGLLPEPAVK